MMGHLYEALKAGVRGFKSGSEPSEYSIAGRTVRCPHCGETTFLPSEAMVTIRIWADSPATALICAECGRIEWFVHAATETGPGPSSPR
jgi:ribosomal protein S27E